MTQGERIKKARLEAGLTQSELAEKIGVKYSAIHKYESGMVVNIKRVVCDKMAAALNVSPAWLFCLDGEGNVQDAIFSENLPENMGEKLHNAIQTLKDMPENKQEIICYLIGKLSEI